MRVTVTGASGFVGRALCSALAKRGHETTELHRRHTGDLANEPDWLPLISGAEAVVHLAAIAHTKVVDQIRSRAVNVDAAVALGRAAAAAKVPLIFVSSVRAVGEETQDGPLVETSTSVCNKGYGGLKAEAEAELRTIERLAVTILRPPLVYGPGVRGNFLALMEAVDRGWPLPLASIRNRRSLVYLGNLVDAIVCCLEVPKAVGRTYFVCDGPPVSTPDLVSAIARSLGKPIRLLPFPPALVGMLPPLRRLTRSLEVDDSAIRRELGWRPPFTFEQGLRATAEWYLAQGR